MDRLSLWKCHRVTRVEKQDMVLQMKKLRPSEICQPVEAPQPSAPFLGAWVLMGQFKASRAGALGGRSLLSAA